MTVSRVTVGWGRVASPKGSTFMTTAAVRQERGQRQRECALGQVYHDPMLAAP